VPVTKGGGTLNCLNIDGFTILPNFCRLAGDAEA
jgi:hypothetical protein